MDRPLVAVADPNDVTRELLAEICQAEFDAYVSTMSSVSDLDHELHETIPRLVMVQIGRDRLADVEALRSLKARHPDIPFIVLTAWGVDREQVEGRVGADVVIAKPFDLAEVIASARQFLDGADGAERAL